MVICFISEYHSTSCSRIPTIMMVLVRIGFLLACIATAYSAAVAPLQKDQGVVFTDWERNLFAKGVYFYDDNEKPVRATLTEEDIAEALNPHKTRVDLPKTVVFNLYTRKNRNSPQVLKVGDAAVLGKTYFSPSKPTRFVTHGWINSKDSVACEVVRNALLNHGDYNVIVVDWSSIAKRPYSWAATHVKDVGKYVGTMIDFLQSRGMSVKNLILAGHSLGAHVVGLAGYYSKHTVFYIVGLDPALPGFISAGEGSRISTKDGKNVEIIHTNAGVLGYSKNIGSIDFFPNGGKSQEGCMTVDPACSHSRAYHYYAESIISNVGFGATECGSYDDYNSGLCKSKKKTKMGTLHILSKPRGKYFLKTNGKSPFAQGG